MKYVVRVKWSAEAPWYAFNGERYPDDAAGLARAQTVVDRMRKAGQIGYQTKFQYSVFRYLGGRGKNAKYKRVE